MTFYVTYPQMSQNMTTHNEASQGLGYIRQEDNVQFSVLNVQM